MTRTRHSRSGAAAFTILTLVLVQAAGAQGPGPQPDMTLTAAQRTEVIEGAIKQLNTYYVFPDVARQMEAAVRKRLAGREYDAITSARALAESLTVHFRAVSHDKHLSVMYSAQPLPPIPAGGKPTPEQVERARTFAKSINFGIPKVERLPGNIGYVRLDGFMPPDMGGETATAAMTFVASTDALIFDLRWNNGGDPAMVAFISSYLFPEATHLNDIYWRPDSTTRQWWTSATVPGKRFSGTGKVYVLTSNHTFSAGEEFTNNLKVLKRATIVGETTGGGANPGGPRPINDHFAVWVPSGRAINPITKGNWEGTGVAPDVAVAVKIALDTAYLDALEHLPAPANPMMAGEIKKAIDSVRKGLEKRR